MHLLIVDSSKLVTERLVELISETRTGIKFIIVNTCHEAIQCLDRFTPQVMLLDLDFPFYKTSQLLRLTNSSIDKIVVIGLFTIQNEYNIRQCKEHGVDYVFDKYEDFEKIPGIVAEVYSGRGLNDIVGF
jgi:DNA-binding NarL/FixJ family response regulator